MSETGGAPDDRLRERVGGSRVTLWAILEADRWVVTGLLVAITFGTLVVAGALLPNAAATLRAGDSIDTMFQALLTATITGVTLVLTLNQVVLSQELGAVGDQRERMRGAMDFRKDVADVIGAPVSPARPAQFLRALVTVAGDRAATLRDATSENEVNAEARTAITDLTDSLVDNAERVGDALDGAQFGTFEVLSAALNFNYSWKIFAARRIQERHGEDLDDAAASALSDTIEVLELFGPAREHFKTLYFQWNLVGLSRRILLTSVPALLVSAVAVTFLDTAAIQGSIAGLDALTILVAGATTVAVIPFLVLLAYVVRIATVTRHTLSIGPFILRETEDVVTIEWDD